MGESETSTSIEVVAKKLMAKIGVSDTDSISILNRITTGHVAPTVAPTTPLSTTPARNPEAKRQAIEAEMISILGVSREEAHRAVLKSMAGHVHEAMKIAYSSPRLREIRKDRGVGSPTIGGEEVLLSSVPESPVVVDDKNDLQNAAWNATEAVGIGIALGLAMALVAKTLSGGRSS